MNPLIVVALPFLATLMKGKKTSDRLEYYPQNLELIKGKLYLDMEILNPTKNDLKIDSVFAGIFAGSKKIGNIERGESFTVKANKRTSIKLPVVPSGLGFATAIADAVKGKITTFKVMGIARALGLDNPINKDLSLTT